MNKTIALAAIVMVAVVMGMSAIAPAMAAPPAKVIICHVDPDGDGPGPETIEVSERSLSAHLAHGDSVGACLA